MAKQIKRLSKYLALLAPLALLVVLLARPSQVHALTFSSPLITSGSGNMQCACASSCSGCGGPSIYSPEGVRWLDGAFVHTAFVAADNPAIDGGTAALVGVYDSLAQGHSQHGRSVRPSYQQIVVRTVVNSGAPWSNGGNYAKVYGEDGFEARHDWNGTAYVAASCGDTNVLSMPTGTSGNYRLTTKHGATVDFNADGLATVFTDTNGNTRTVTYNSSQQVTAYTDDRGFSYAFSQNADGFVDEIDNPTHRVWTFGYDAAGNLTSVTTPPTAQQTSGVTYEYGYDSSNRMTSIKDGRGNTVKTIAYVGSTGQVDSITMDGNTVDYSYATNRVDRTDRLGNVHRTHLSGNKIVQTDMWISGAAQFVHTFNYV